MPNGGMENFLSSRGIDPLTLHDQIRARSCVGYRRANRVQRIVNVSDQEIDDIIEQMRAESGQPEYRVSEIFSGL